MKIEYKTHKILDAVNQRKFIWKLFRKGKQICCIDIVKDFEEGELRIYHNVTKVIFLREK